MRCKAYQLSHQKIFFLIFQGFEISARPLANANVKPFGRVEIVNYSPGLASGNFIFRKIELFLTNHNLNVNVPVLFNILKALKPNTFDRVRVGEGWVLTS